MHRTKGKQPPVVPKDRIYWECDGCQEGMTLDFNRVLEDPEIPMEVNRVHSNTSPRCLYLGQMASGEVPGVRFYRLMEISL